MNKKNLSFVVISGVLGAVFGITVAKWNTPSPTVDSGTNVTITQPVKTASNGTLGDSFVQVKPVELQAIENRLVINGKLALNGLNLHQLSARISGRIDRITLLEGGYVRAGEPVALLYSPEFISAQNEYLLARRSVKTLNTRSTEDLYEDAKATLDGARNKLRILGASVADIAYLDERGTAQEHLSISSPISGRVTKRNVDPGGYLNSGDSLGSVADMSTLWFVGNAFEDSLAQLHEGQDVIITVPSLSSNGPLKGRISFVAPTVDPQTHSVAVRVDIANVQGQLKPEMFAKAQINLGTRQLPVVPRSAVVQDGAESFVLVQRSAGSFERVSVKIAPANDPDHLSILSGLLPQDQVVVEGGVLVDRSIVNSAAARAASAAEKAKP